MSIIKRRCRTGKVNFPIQRVQFSCWIQPERVAQAIWVFGKSNKTKEIVWNHRVPLHALAILHSLHHRQQQKLLRLNANCSYRLQKYENWIKNPSSLKSNARHVMIRYLWEPKKKRSKNLLLDGWIKWFS